MLWGLLVLMPPAVSALGRDEVAETAARAQAAYKKKDYKAFLAESQGLTVLAPHSVRAQYNLACAQSLNGHAAQAVGLLDQLATGGAAFDVEADGDFAGLKTRPDFQAVVRKMKALDTPIGSSTLAFTLPEKTLLTEGIAYDPKSDAFFVSSVHRRKVLRVTRNGAVSDFVAEAQDGLLSAVALVVDPARRALWVSSEAHPPMIGIRPEDAGRSFVFEYDLDTAKLRRRLGPPAGLADAHLSDIGLGPAGELYVSDPESGRIYVLASGAEQLKVLVDVGPLGSPQGLTWSEDGRWLFVADYTQGIARVDPRTGAVVLLAAPADALLTGIDGLVFAHGSLVGIQNGIAPHKLLRLQLDDTATRVAAVSVLERRNPLFDEPTLAVKVGGELYYVANSQWNHVRQDGSLDEEHMSPPAVLRLRLDW